MEFLSHKRSRKYKSLPSSHLLPPPPAVCLVWFCFFIHLPVELYKFAKFTPSHMPQREVRETQMEEERLLYS